MTGKPPCCCAGKGGRCDEQHCDHCRPGEAYTPDQCRVCWLWHHDPAYRRRCQEEAPDLPAAARGTAVPARRERPCRHLGEEHRQQECRTCRGQVRIKVLTCAVHTECSLAKLLPGVACCRTCPDYEPQPGPERSAENQTPAAGPC